MASVQITMNRAWTGATPVLVTNGAEGQPSSTLNEATAHLLGNANLPQSQTITWIGVEMSVATSGASPIALMGGGPYAPSLSIVINGTTSDTRASALALSAFEVGVTDCPFVWQPQFGLPPSSSSTGCFALAVPTGSTVSVIGFDLSTARGYPGLDHIAQWSV